MALVLPVVLTGVWEWVSAVALGWVMALVLPVVLA
jgi:hypothetical protein